MHLREQVTLRWLNFSHPRQKRFFLLVDPHTFPSEGTVSNNSDGAVTKGKLPQVLLGSPYPPRPREAGLSRFEGTCVSAYLRWVMILGR